MTTGIRSSFVQPQSAPRSDINVTPLVDVVLVLLIIFMVVTPLMTRDIEVQAPPPSDGAPSTPPPRQVMVRIRADGQLTLDDVPIHEADYVPRLRELMEARTPRERVALFQPDDRASYARLVAVLDGARAAGVETLGILAPPPEATHPPR